MAPGADRSWPFVSQVALPMWLSSTKVSLMDRIERISDAKDLKKLLRTRNNLLVLYSKSGAWAGAVAAGTRAPPEGLQPVPSGEDGGPG